MAILWLLHVSLISPHTFTSVFADHPQETLFPAYSIIYPERTLYALSHARNVCGPFSLSACQSQQILRIFLLFSFELIPYCLT